MKSIPKALKGHLKSLGNRTKYKYDGADAKLLEAFPNPFKGHMTNGSIHIVAPEFTSLCPITGQPDFATIDIEYTPNNLCVESKSLKLYLGTYRQAAMFHESCTKKICDDLAALLKPRHIRVIGQFSPRGGISFWPIATWNLPLQLTDLRVGFPSRNDIHGKRKPA